MLKKILIIFLFNLFIFSNGYSLDFNKVYNVKIFSSAKLEVNDTNLVDKENAEKLVENIEDLDAVLKGKSTEISKQNRDRKTQKFKGAEDIFNDYEKSVVYIGSRKNNEWIGSGSGFISGGGVITSSVLTTSASATSSSFGFGDITPVATKIALIPMTIIKSIESLYFINK